MTNLRKILVLTVLVLVVAVVCLFFLGRHIIDPKPSKTRLQKFDFGPHVFADIPLNPNNPIWFKTSPKYVPEWVKEEMALRSKTSDSNDDGRKMPDIEIPGWDLVEKNIFAETKTPVSEWIEFFGSNYYKFSLVKVSNALEEDSVGILNEDALPTGSIEEVLSGHFYYVSVDIILTQERTHNFLKMIALYVYSNQLDSPVIIKNENGNTSGMRGTINNPLRNLKVFNSVLEKCLPLGIWRTKQGIELSLFTPENIPKHLWGEEFLGVTLLDLCIGTVSPPGNYFHFYTKPFYISKGLEQGNISLIEKEGR